MRRLFKLSILAVLALSIWIVPASRSLAENSPVQPELALASGYTNPLPIRIPGDGMVESCADPSLIKGQQLGDNKWYMYCTTDPLNDDDRDQNGNYVFHSVPILSSTDLISWTYETDVFTSSTRPIWAEQSAGIWAPEIHYSNNLYYLYYGVTDVTPAISGEPVECRDDNAIGVATSVSPLGPWVDHGVPVVAPRRGGPGCNFFWTYDPEVVTTAGGQKYLYYGSYYGGIWARELSSDGFTAPEATQVQVTIANRYEGAEVAFRNGFYYLFVSAANCCNGPLTGYSVFVGRSASPTGPFVDREGVSLLAGRVGGTPFLSLNGNRWVGLGHNSVFTDLAGQWWTVYHAIDENQPFFTPSPLFANLTKRPVLLDPIDWIDGWPTVRGGAWASDTPQAAPVAQPGGAPAQAAPRLSEPRLGPLLPAFSDEFSSTLGMQWSWVRQPISTTYAISNSAFLLDTAAGDLFVDSNTAPVLLQNAPGGDYIVETKMKFNVPAEGCCFNYTQAGLVIYGDDNNFIKLVHVSIWETRQTEFAKEQFPVPANYPRYGNTVGGPPGETTWLRIGRKTHGGSEYYTAYTSRDGATWVRGGTWKHSLGQNAKIGLVAMGRGGFQAEFDYVRTYRWFTHQRWLPLMMR